MNQSASKESKAEPASLKDQARNVLEEARMVLPGIQALFGFQLIAVFNQRFESIKKVSRLNMPVLYIHGTADRVVPYNMGIALYEQSGGQKRFVAVAGGGHDDNAAVAPAEVATALRDLIR